MFRTQEPGILPQSVCFSFTPSELAQDLFFYPVWCGHYYCTSTYCIDRQYYFPLLLFFIRSGNLHFRYQNLDFVAHSGDVVLLDCRYPHYYKAEGRLEFLYLNFDGSNSHQLSQYILNAQGPLIQKENNTTIGQELYDMVDFYQHDGMAYLFESSMRIYHIFGLLFEPSKKEKEEGSPIKQVIQYIDNNFGRQITVEEMAGVANLSIYYFSRLFKKLTGFSPREYVIKTRLNKAEVLLKRTSKSISEIALEVGYNDCSSFIKLFTKTMGCSPRQYRKQWGKTEENVSATTT